MPETHSSRWKLTSALRTVSWLELSILFAVQVWKFKFKLLHKQQTTFKGSLSKVLSRLAVGVSGESRRHDGDKLKLELELELGLERADALHGAGGCASCRVSE